MNNLYRLELPPKAQLGHQHTQNSLAIASLQKSLRGRESKGFLSEDCQSRQSTKKSGESSVESGAVRSWIFSASDEYLAALDLAGVSVMFRAINYNDICTKWVDA